MYIIKTQNLLFLFFKEHKNTGDLFPRKTFCISVFVFDCFSSGGGGGGAKALFHYNHEAFHTHRYLTNIGYRLG